MIELLRFFVRLARLQKAPQDLPGSTALLLLCMAVDVAVGVAGGTRYFGSAPLALLANVLDVAVVAGMVWLLLTVNGHPARLIQTLTGLYGLGALFGLAMILVEALSLGMSGNPVASILALGVLAWAQLAMGHVLRHALDQNLLAGVIFAVGINVVSFVVVGNLLPLPPAPAG